MPDGGYLYIQVNEENYSIEARQLTKVYGSATAIKNISFQIRKGEVVGFLGPNGAGKSTTLRILTGLLAATSGEAQVEGVSVARDPASVKKLIGYMPENNPLPEDLRVLEYLRLRARLKGVPHRKIRGHLEEVMEICDLHRKARRKIIGSLSKGFRQRVGIADALIGNPRITIMDEPTIGLDPHQVLLIRELIRNLKERTTVIISSHILSEIEVFCDRVMILNQGRLVASGSPSELRQEFIPGSIFLLQIAGSKADLEKLLENYADEFQIIWEYESPDGTPHRLRLEFTKDTDPSRELMARIQKQPQLQLYAWHRNKPSLEDIFLIATRRSWDVTEDEPSAPNNVQSIS